MARSKAEKSAFIKTLEETPLASYACKKVGIGRTTFYRWMRTNYGFKRDVERALKRGRSQWNEIAESALMKNVKNGKMDAIKFYLTHNEKRYAPKRSVFIEDPMTEKDKERYEWAVRNKPLTKEQAEKIAGAWMRWEKSEPGIMMKIKERVDKNKAEEAAAREKNKIREDPYDTLD